MLCEECKLMKILYAILCIAEALLHLRTRPVARIACDTTSKTCPKKHKFDCGWGHHYQQREDQESHGKQSFDDTANGGA